MSEDNGQAQTTPEVVIRMTPDGNIAIGGNVLNNMVMALGMLETAKASIIQHHQRRQEDRRIEPVNFFPQGLPKQ